MRITDVKLRLLSGSMPIEGHFWEERLSWREGGQTLIGSGYLASPFVLDAEGCVAILQEPGLGVEIE